MKLVWRFDRDTRIVVRGSVQSIVPTPPRNMGCGRVTPENANQALGFRI